MATEKEKLEKKFAEKLKQQEVAVNYLNEIQKQIAELELELRAFKPVHVTEHALIRYFERVYKVPVQDIREELNRFLNDIPLKVKKSPNIRYCHNGLNLLLKHGTVVTILDSEELVENPPNGGCQADK